MTHILLGLLALVVPGGIIGLIAKFGLATVLGTAGDYLKQVPRQVWIALAICAVLVAVVIWHHSKVKAHDTALVKATIDARDAAWSERLAAEHAAALKWKGQADARFAEISKLQRKVTDEENRRIAADRDALRLHGPGKAAAPAGCRPGDHPGLPAVAGRRNAQPGAAQDPGAQMPAEDRAGQWAVVPWDWLVDVVSERDSFRVEAIAWRGWHATIEGEWDRLRSQTPKSSPPAKGPTDG